jgi:hypothetical protein
MAIGFCDDQAPLNRMLGWEPGAWGFHSDDGRVYEDGRLSWKGVEYHAPYVKKAEKSKKVTIGCGVNFAQNTAFYTKDGLLIGESPVSYLPPNVDERKRERVEGTCLSR